MTKASKSIKHLDKVLNSHNSFGDDPESFVEKIIKQLDHDILKLLEKSKPEHWSEIYVERDRALIKQGVLNKIMSKA